MEKNTIKLHHVKCMVCDYLSFFSGNYVSYYCLHFSICGKTCIEIVVYQLKDKVGRIGVRAMKIRKSLLITVHLQVTARKDNFIAVGSGHVPFGDLMASVDYRSNMY